MNRLRISTLMKRSMHHLRSMSTKYDKTTERSFQVLEPGMVLVKNFIGPKQQADILRIIQKHGAGPEGFSREKELPGGNLRSRTMCFGQQWAPETGYQQTMGGFEAPPLPLPLIKFVRDAIVSVQSELGPQHATVPMMIPNVALAHFLEGNNRLGLHQDRDEGHESLAMGLPVVSFFLGDTANFMYGRARDESQLERVSVQSGDCLIFGGPSRFIFHGIEGILPRTLSQESLQETNLNSGCLYLTCKQR